MRFREFLENTEEVENIEDLLHKIPNSHANLVKGYKWHFQSGNTLEGDDEHVAVIDHNKKTITLASPWNYGREHVALHEIAHLVWNKLLSSKLKDEWKEIAKSTKMPKNDRQADEELMAHAYANFYADNKTEKFCFPTWDNFIKKLPS